MYESLEETFSRLSTIFDVNLEPSQENLTRLQNCEIELDGRETAVANLVAPQRIKMNETWDQVDVML